MKVVMEQIMCQTQNKTKKQPFFQANLQLI